MSFSGFAIKQFDTIIKDIKKQAPGVCRNNGIEPLHELRVGLRRLDNALRFYKNFFPKKKLKFWRKILRKASEKVAKARDRDVLIAFLIDYKNKLRHPDEKVDIQRFIVRLKIARQYMQSQVGVVALGLQKNKIFDEILECLHRAKSSPLSRQSQIFYKAVSKHIAKEIKEELSYEKMIADPRRIEELHGLRIANKGLRYSLEGLKTAYDPALNKFLKPVLFFHKDLGDIHDFDVWQEYFSRLLRKGKIKAGSKGALQELQRFWKEKRQKTYIHFMNNWKKYRKEHLFENLLEYLNKTHLKKR